ncbi:hypothetical protein PENSPDRAFT_99407 [Peniophora sp. CONT]|nr:hypothetical protein PENSPDRAFT_99407 [Peniophora sp. CONT]
MFPVTFNAIGDILALAQLLYDIVHTLDDARGAPAEIQRFAHELELLGIVIANVHRVGDASLDDALKEAVLTEARLCYVEIVNAGKLLPGFDSLLQSTVGNSSLGRARLMAKKLQWHFMKASDAAAFATRFHDIYLRLSVLIGSLNHHTIEASLAQVSRQLNGLSAVAEHEHSFTREEML